MASSLTFERIAEMLNAPAIINTLRSHQIAVLSTVGAAVALRWAIIDYQTYLSYGPGGLPYNIGGWSVANLLRAISGEQRSSTPYDNPTLPFADEPGYLPANFPPTRRSPRPTLGPHAAPQRQLDQLPSEELRQQLIDRFADLGSKAQRKGLADIKQSLAEKQHSALFVSTKRTWHPVAQQTRGEISHIHAGRDGSIHVTLHPADCKKVFESEWGQRHGLSGVKALKRMLLPVTYVLIYAPRDEAEVDVAMTIVQASIQFMTGTRQPID